MLLLMYFLFLSVLPQLQLFTWQWQLVPPPAFVIHPESAEQCPVPGGAQSQLHQALLGAPSFVPHPLPHAEREMVRVIRLNLFQLLAGSTKTENLDTGTNSRRQH